MHIILLLAIFNIFMTFTRYRASRIYGVPAVVGHCGELGSRFSNIVCRCWRIGSGIMNSQRPS